MSNICDKITDFGETEIVNTDILLLTKISSKEKLPCGENAVKDVFPRTLIQAVFDGITGIRLDTVLSLCNFVYVPWKGSIAATRLSIGSLMRRASLVICYRNNHGEFYVEQYKNNETTGDDAWLDDINWQSPFKDATVNIPLDLLQGIVNNWLNNLDLSTILGDLNAKVELLVNEYLAGAGDVINSAINNYIGSHITDALLNLMIQDYLNTHFTDAKLQELINNALTNIFNPENLALLDKLKELFTQIIDEMLAAKLTELYDMLINNERVVANALTRHELTLTSYNERLAALEAKHASDPVVTSENQNNPVV